MCRVSSGRAPGSMTKAPISPVVVSPTVLDGLIEERSRSGVSSSERSRSI